MRLTESITRVERKDPPQRIERKFIVVYQNLDFARSLLRQTCRPDREYPSEQINSLYFDSSDLDQHYRSLSGEYCKEKVRLRWYGQGEELNGSVPVFIERKSRSGFASMKQRHQVFVPAKSLKTKNLHRGVIPAASLLATLAEFGYFPGARLVPIIMISYWRYRFVELMTGTRAALDRRIRAIPIARHLSLCESELELPGGVIEIKGNRMELPLALCRLRNMELDWSRFSKYSSCISACSEPPGVVNRSTRIVNI